MRYGSGIDIHQFNAASREAALAGHAVYDPALTQREHDMVLPRVCYGGRPDPTFMANTVAIASVPVRIPWLFLTKHTWGWKDQCNVFLDLIEKATRQPGALPYSKKAYVDFEPERGVAPLNQKDADDCWSAVEYIEYRTGWEVGIYTRREFWESLLLRVVRKDTTAWLARYPYANDKWGSAGAQKFLANVTHYPNSYADDKNYRPGPISKGILELWQYSADGNGQGAVNGVKSRNVDLDRCVSMTSEELIAKYGQDQPNPSPPIPAPVDPDLIKIRQLLTHLLARILALFNIQRRG